MRTIQNQTDNHQQWRAILYIHIETQKLIAENIRDCFTFDPIEVQPHPCKPGKYRILDSVHRWNACKATGVTEPYPHPPDPHVF
ncbi:ParB N-terminal domain-containing protein [bacterium]|nr:ParB N-terminal domain-containing protein [bacterium]